MKCYVILMALFVITGCRQGPGTSYYADQEIFDFDGEVATVEVVPELPLIVDEWFGPSGYMGDGEDGLIEATSCPMRDPRARGSCHRFVWTPGQKGWAGVFWQYPDGNWGTAEGLAVPEGSGSVRFTAWGETGNEQVTFGAGMGDADGFSEEIVGVNLTTTPTEYVIDMADIEYDRVVGGFVWTCSQMADEVVFFVDDIRWDTKSP